jgi:hypothetical protein
MRRGFNVFPPEYFLFRGIRVDEGETLAVAEMQSQSPVCQRDRNSHGFVSLPCPFLSFSYDLVMATPHAGHFFRMQGTPRSCGSFRPHCGHTQ